VVCGIFTLELLFFAELHCKQHVRLSREDWLKLKLTYLLIQPRFVVQEAASACVSVIKNIAVSRVE